jgi:hypothetical protein
MILFKENFQFNQKALGCCSLIYGISKAGKIFLELAIS